MLGLKKNLNLLVDYNPLWEAAFIEERERLDRMLGNIAKGIEHYGSTAVPGMRAKPILDILVGVIPLDDWAKCRAPLEALGYDYAAQAGVPGHHIFGRGRDFTERTHLVHVVELASHLVGRSCCGFRAPDEPGRGAGRQARRNLHHRLGGVAVERQGNRQWSGHFSNTTTESGVQCL
jgi:hypothetical protein